MAIDDYREAVEQGGPVLFTIHVHYQRGATVVESGWAVFDSGHHLLHSEPLQRHGGNVLEALEAATVEACLTWDWADTTFTHPRLPL